MGGRAGDNQDNSILLTNALKNQFHEVASFPSAISSQLREVGVTSDSGLDIFNLGFTYNTGASKYSKQIDVQWHGDNARIQSSHKGQSLSSDGSNSWTSGRTTPVVSKCKTPLSSEDTWKNTPDEASSCTLQLKSVLSLDFLNVAAQHDKLDITDVRSPSQHRGETNGNMESIMCSAHMDLGFPDFSKMSIGYPKELAEKSQQSVTLSTYHDSGPNWSTTFSISFNEWDFNLSSVSSVKPAEGFYDLVTKATSMDNEFAHHFENNSASYDSIFQLSTEPIEFPTFLDKTILHLWEEVDVMEAQQVLASPTIGINNDKGKSLLVYTRTRKNQKVKVVKLAYDKEDMSQQQSQRADQT
ncbi:hypothetical protein AgCh_038726 [Apium graveolens]